VGKTHTVATRIHTVMTLTVIIHAKPTFMSAFHESAGQCTVLYNAHCATMRNMLTYNCVLKDELKDISVERCVCVHSKVTEFRLYRQVSRIWAGRIVFAPALSRVDWLQLKIPHFILYSQYILQPTVWYSTALLVLRSLITSLWTVSLSTLKPIHYMLTCQIKC
jgi:hypothetical protein